MNEIIQKDKEQIIAEPEKAPTILEEYERWKVVPPKINEKQPLTFDEIARKEGCDAPNLETDIRSKVEKFAEDMKRECSYPSLEYVGLVDSLYNLYLQSKNSDVVKENPWGNQYKLEQARLVLAK